MNKTKHRSEVVSNVEMDHATNLQFIETETQNESRISVEIEKTICIYINPPLLQKDRSFLIKVFDHIERNISDSKYGVGELSAALFVSESQLRRRVKTLTGMSPLKLIRHIRLHTAAEILLKGHNVKHAMHETGFDNPSYFGELFKELFSSTPGTYAKKHSSRNDELSS